MKNRSGADLTVSVIIPVYNGSRYIQECLQSVAEQTRAPGEIIVVDDGSADDTAEKVRGPFPLVRYIFRAHSGADAARNKAVREASGELFIFLDADDIAETNRIELQQAYLSAHPDTDAVFGHLMEFVASEQGAPVYRAKKPGCCVGTLMIKKEAFLRAGYFETRWKVAGFMDWYFKAQEKQIRFHMLDDVLIRRRIHRANLTLQNQEVLSREYAEVIKASLERKRKIKRGREEA